MAMVFVSLVINLAACLGGFAIAQALGMPHDWNVFAIFTAFIALNARTIRDVLKLSTAKKIVAFASFFPQISIFFAVIPVVQLFMRVIK